MGSALIAAGATIASTVIQANQQKKANKQNQKNFDKSLEFNEKEAQVAQKRAYLNQKSLGLTPTADTVANAPVASAPSAPDIQAPQIADLGQSIASGLSAGASQQSVENQQEQLRLQKAEILKGCYANDQEFADNFRSIMGSNYSNDVPLYRQMIENPDYCSLASAMCNTSQNLREFYAGQHWAEQANTRAYKDLDFQIDSFLQTLQLDKDKFKFDKENVHWEQAFKYKNFEFQKQSFFDRLDFDKLVWDKQKEYIDAQIKWGNNSMNLDNSKWKQEVSGYLFSKSFSQWLQSEELKIKQSHSKFEWKVAENDMIKHWTNLGKDIAKMAVDILPTKWISSLRNFGNGGSSSSTNGNFSAPTSSQVVPNNPQTSNNPFNYSVTP